MLKYEDIKCIGRGSYGSAHLVTEKTTGNRFVIKKIPMELLSDSEKQQSFREVELLAKLKHPNVVEYKESFVEQNVIHIVMAYCDGGDLAGRIKERAAILANGGHGYFDTRQVLDWFVQMAMAIKYLHEQRILHRDLKTSNIFLTTTNVIKLGDFGIAKTLDSTLDQAKTVVGTPYYMSPEVCESKPYSYASDVWSLGCVLYEMVALRHAFDAPNILTLILKIVQNDFAAIPAHYDSEISDILKRLLDKNPEKRPTMDQIFLMPYVRNHMQALVESGGSLKMNVVARRPHGTPKRRTQSKSGRRSSGDTSSRTRHSNGSSSSSTRWASIAPTDREDLVLGEGSDLELLDASMSMDDSNLDIRLPERSRTPEPLMLGPSEDMVLASVQESKPSSGIVRSSPTRKKQTPSTGQWADPRQRRPSADEVEEELDTRFQNEAAEALMNPNFQRVYAEECDDSLTVKYAPQLKNRPRLPSHDRPVPKTGGVGKPPKPEMPSQDAQRRMADIQRQDRIRGGSGREQSRVDTRPMWARPARRVGSGTITQLPTTTPALDEPSLDDTDPRLEASGGAGSLSDSGMLRQLEMEDASSSDGNADEYSSNSGEEYEGEENFYSEHSAYSDDSDFAGEDNDAEYSDDFEEVDGEVIEYANDEFVAEEDTTETSSGRHSSTELVSPAVGLDVKSPKMASSPATRRAPREVQWVMRNVAQSLLESCENLSVA